MKKRNSLLALALLALALVAGWFAVRRDSPQEEIREPNPRAVAPDSQDPRSDLAAPAPEIAEPDLAEMDAEAATQRTAIEVASPQSLNSLRGRVLDSLGTPIGSTFWVGASTGGVPQRSKYFSNLEGEFVFEDPIPGVWKVTASADGYWGLKESVEVNVPQEEALELRLTRRHVVAGLVVDPTGAPVPEANISAMRGFERPDRRLRFSSDSQTDEFGRFSLKEIELGRHQLFAEHPEWGASEILAIELVPGQPIPDMTFTLKHSASLTGIAYLEDGSPAAQREVELAYLGEFISNDFKQTTDGSGRFSFQHLEPGSALVALSMPSAQSGLSGRAAPGESLLNETTETVELRAGRETQVVIGGRPKFAVRVFGKIHRTSGPLGRSAIIAVPEGQPPLASMAQSRASEDGNYELRLADSGNYQFTIIREGVGTQAGLAFPRKIPRVAEYELNFTFPAGAIRGRVVDAEGQPFQSVRLTLAREDGEMGSLILRESRHTNTDDQGEFAFEELRPGTYAIRTQPSGNSSSGLRASHKVHGNLRVGADEVLDGIEIQVGPGGLVSGIAQDSEKQPIAWATIFAHDERGHVVDPQSLRESDIEGKFVLGKLAEGRYHISARTTDQVSKPTLVTISSKGIASTELVLEPGTLLTITTSEASGERAPVRLSVKDQAGLEYANLIDGRTLEKIAMTGRSSSNRKIGPLASGVYTIHVSTDDGRSLRETIRVSGEPKQLVKLRFN